MRPAAAEICLADQWRQCRDEWSEAAGSIHGYKQFYLTASFCILCAQRNYRKR
jgi:hypothetical protein